MSEESIEFQITPEKIKNKEIKLLYDEDAFSGVIKIADKIINDLDLLFGEKPEKMTFNQTDLPSYPIIFGTLDKSELLDKLEKEKLITLKPLRDKLETFSINIVKSPLENTKSSIIIAGSDKRGTIYGLFYFTKLMGISPFVDWCDVCPKKLDKFVLTNTKHNYISKEPSVKFRGFFINDEWPAFGNWTMKNFGGFNAKAYAHVFELLLRLNGNYLWPAMWSSRFSSDGPGLESAALADELGVVMGMSHHEPCLRHGEDYKYFRGKDSIYGDAWNFRTNEKGITKFWEDGLIRCGKFENVITVGMRGEADSAIMGDATLKDNIDLLRDVLKTQNNLIRKFVNNDIFKVPRMLALYKEVEPYFYGDDETEGLIGSEELEGVTLMLCDDNFGNLRTLPTPEMKNHRGGYGMYYHFDYHGGPVSYEWVNSSYLPKVWEQMTQAYEFDVKELWIVNVGDIFTTEFPLAYFLALAYDNEKWGINNLNSPFEFTKQFIEENIATVSDITEEQKKDIYEILNGYTRIAHNRRPEAMNSNVYDAEFYNETDELLNKIEYLINKTEKLRNELKGNLQFPFYQFIYYPTMANLNLQKMQLLTTKNHFYAITRSNLANILAKEIDKCLVIDQNLVNELHNIKNGKWYGMGLSEHIGFNSWNEEQCQYPIVHTFKPANKPRIIVLVPGTHQITEGGDWTKRELLSHELLNPGIDSTKIDILNASNQQIHYDVVVNCNEIITLSKNSGEIALERESIELKLNREKLNNLLKNEEKIDNVVIKDDHVEILVQINTNICHATVRVLISRNDEKALPLYIRKSQYENYTENTYIYCGLIQSNLREFDCASRNNYPPLNYVSIEARHFIENKSSEKGKFKMLEGFGKTDCGLKVFPVDLWFTEDDEDKPSLEYNVVMKEEGTFEISCYLGPSNPVDKQQKIDYMITVNKEKKTIKSVGNGYRVGDGNPFWEMGARDNIRISKSEFEFNAGLNKILISPLTPGFVLEKIVIVKKGESFPQSFLGPKETYFIKNKN